MWVMTRPLASVEGRARVQTGAGGGRGAVPELDVAITMPVISIKRTKVSESTT